MKKKISKLAKGASVSANRQLLMIYSYVVPYCRFQSKLCTDFKGFANFSFWLLQAGLRKW